MAGVLAGEPRSNSIPRHGDPREVVEPVGLRRRRHGDARERVRRDFPRLRDRAGGDSAPRAAARLGRNFVDGFCSKC
jgi:hypothetical protein